jgi:FdhE protein
MQRILDPTQIEAFAERSIPWLRLPDPRPDPRSDRGTDPVLDRGSGPGVFSDRAGRLRALSEGHSLREYLLLMAALADAQQVQFDELRPALVAEGFAQHIGQQIEVAKAHRMPVLQAAGWPRQARWRGVLRALCGAIIEGGSPGSGVDATPPDAAGGARSPAVTHTMTGGGGADGAVAERTPPANASGGTRGAFPPAVYALCERIAAANDADLDAQADLLIATRSDGVDAQAAPFILAALQVYWAAMASTLRVTDVVQLDVPTVCPVCGSLPVASVVRSDKRGPQGYRYLHCGLCESEWHMVRITCSHCLSTEGITYHCIEGGSEALRAETCGKCQTYRKILYQEKDIQVEPVADDLSSLALDLLMTAEGFHRGSGNPLLWQTSDT